MPSVWITPGGGLLPGESYEQAARRELWEETGITVRELGPCLWIRRVWEEQLHKIERFFLVRTCNATVSTAAMDPTEAAEISDHRWWSAREIQLAMAKENFAPGELGQLLPPIIAGEISPEPTEIDS